MIHPTNPNAVRVKRDGPRGWHWIDGASFDPAVHVLTDDRAGQAYQPVADAQTVPAKSAKKGKRK